MHSLNSQVVDALAKRHDFSRDAIAHMVSAVADGDGQMAMFSHPEFGGPGQWMQGGMLMLSGPIDHPLNARVDALCREIGEMIGEMKDASGDELGGESGDETAAQQSAWAAAEENTTWWPSALGAPNATGEQNGLRYAYFAQARRLVVQTGESVRVYDCLDHRIEGIAQQQGSQSRLTLTSQHGNVDLAGLPVISTDRHPPN
ncbi:SHOCT domain-containing protein [Halomonas sp. ANAO-440]|uniref:SHOCT domain-containing protein n=1 Tax=Halomonas sp. ANAO-440 TaxID=2861360 RepID=UPI001CAA4C96|nr:SHOCT domain-containing protein [Halomonas sp. ANAO-440]MBZ0329643.1 SHOCT domain-containing protein [Halomonas sp. ANAO-440]